MPSKRSSAVRLSLLVQGAIRKRKKTADETPDTVLRRLLRLPDRDGNLPDFYRLPPLFVATWTDGTDEYFATGNDKPEARGELLKLAIIDGKRPKNNEIKCHTYEAVS